ncbi:ATP-grasp domain-containing protein [Fodinibius saliphilus]|uniref:ATP-grasp domain-containing protein n=1 Tax=Fodinibius saliphilus TaxID=1920650 RepID=UPI001108DE08|nr:hypothetical protein [Fodinibius saliphilus]
MKIAIHRRKNSFSANWIKYCENKGINYKVVDCYSNNIINQVQECDALMWHFSQANPKDILFAKELTFSLQTAGKKVFPNFPTAWHFDDKVGQKYLLESIGAPLVPSYVFYDKDKALDWVGETSFPKVFKLRRGAGSAHVKLIETKSEATKMVNKAFRQGFRLYNKRANLKNRWYKYKKGQTDLWNLAKGALRFFKEPEYSRIAGHEKGYVYFQDFIAQNDYDIRVIVIGDRAFAIKRLVREGDFRASGSGHISYEKRHFDEATIELSFKMAEKINSQCLALDYVFQDNQPLIVEISYGFVKEGYYPCKGYWDRDLNWHEGSFNAQGWMVETVLS